MIYFHNVPTYVRVCHAKRCVMTSHWNIAVTFKGLGIRNVAWVHAEVSAATSRARGRCTAMAQFHMDISIHDRISYREGHLVIPPPPTRILG